MVQWSTKAKQMVEQEKEAFGKEIEDHAILTLYRENTKRKQYGLPPKHRIDEQVLKQTIINIVADVFSGDASKNKHNVLENGGMYQ